MTQHDSDADDAAPVEYKTSWGAFSVPGNSFLASVHPSDLDEQQRAEQVERGEMRWSLGLPGDLFWMLVPETRPVIYRLVKRVFDNAIEEDSFLTRPSDTEIADSVWYDVLRPALHDMPSQEDLVRRCFGVVRRILDRNDSHLDSVMVLELINPLRYDGFGPTLQELDPNLYQAVEDRWPRQ